jgi:uncharacterized membrane protein YfcA
VAAELAAASAVVGHVQTIPRVWSAIRWRRTLLFVAAGLMGVPIGTWLLPQISVRGFKLTVGFVLVAYCGYLFWMMVRPPGGPSRERGGSLADAAVGFGGGVMAGVAGLAGVLPIIWSTLKPWNKDEKRALVQSFNLTMLSAMLVSSWLAGLVTAEFWRSLVVALPATIIGAQFGARLYWRLDAHRFDRVVLALLFLSGISLIVSNL